MQQHNRIWLWFLYQSRRPVWPPVRGYPEGLCEMPGEWSAGRINPPESCRDRTPWRRGVPVWSARFFQYANLVYFAGAHIGAPLQSRYRIMWIWCIFRAPTWGRPYNLVSSSRRGGPAWPPVRDSKKAKLFCVL